MDLAAIRISLGGNCAPTYHLDRLGLRTCAYPFDWAKVSINQLIQVLENNFVGYFNLTDSKFSHAHSSILITNSFGIKFAHELRDEKLVQEFSKSLERRIERFKTLVVAYTNTTKIIKFYRIEMSPIKPIQYIKLIKKLIDQLNIYVNQFVLTLVIHKDYITDLEELANNSIIQLVPFNSYSEDWQMNQIDWDQVLK
jgi:hypothetical protein